MKASGSLTGLLVAAWTSSAAAQTTPRFALSWNGPPGCPSAENVQARVDALLGDGASASIADVRASGQVERVDGGFRLLLTMGVGSAPSSRIIEARTCDELAGAAAIAIALLARSSSGSEPVGAATAGDESASTPAADAEKPAPPPPAPPPAPVDTDEEPPAPASSDRLRLLIDVPVGTVGWGTLPKMALGLGVGLGARWKTLRVVARGDLWQPQTNDVAGFQARFTLQSARVEACVTQNLSWLEVGPCLGGALQRLTGDGLSSEVFAARSRSVLWFSGTGGIFASLPTPGFAHLRFFGQGSVVLSPIRPRFVIDRLGAAHEPALAAPRLDLGCEWIF